MSRQGNPLPEVAMVLAFLIFGSVYAIWVDTHPEQQWDFRISGPTTVHLTQPLAPGECVTQDMPEPAVAIRVCVRDVRGVTP